MKITFLIDNIANTGLKHEWGLAVYIEYNGHRILLDTGASKRFARNAKTLGIDLSQVDIGVLSHAHYDHANGLSEFFAENSTAHFFLREGSRENCYGSKWIFRKYVGIKRGYLEKYADRITFAVGDTVLCDGVSLIPHKTPGLEAIGKKAGMLVKENGRMRADDFAHEQSLVFDTKKGLVIFNSCSHGGADNIINEVAATFPGKQVYALIGGFHLFASPEKDVRALGERIKSTGIEVVYTGHCTGNKAFKILREVLGDTVQQIRTGMEIEI